MKKYILLSIFWLSIAQSFAQADFDYGVTAGLNISTAILPELKLNNNISDILSGDDVVKGQAQLADFKPRYKFGIFGRLDSDFGFLKVNLNYTSTNIHKDIDAYFFDVKVLDIALSYIDVDVTYNIYLSDSFYVSLGYIPSFLLSHSGDIKPSGFDSRILSGVGVKLPSGTSIDLDVVLGLSEAYKDSYIHHVMIPLTVSIPLN